VVKPTLTTRVKRLEDCFEERGEALERIDDKLKKLDYDVNNGMGDRISRALMEHQEKQWQAERDRRLKEAEEQLSRNREYGEKRDAEQARQMKTMEIKTKLWAAVVPAAITVVGIITVALLTRGG